MTCLVGFLWTISLPHAWIMMIELKSLCGLFVHMYIPCYSLIFVLLNHVLVILYLCCIHILLSIFGEVYLWYRLFWIGECFLCTSFVGICVTGTLWYVSIVGTIWCVPIASTLWCISIEERVKSYQDDYMFVHMCLTCAYTLCLTINAMSDHTHFFWPRGPCMDICTMSYYTGYGWSCVVHDYISSWVICVVFGLMPCTGHICHVQSCTMLSHMCRVRPCAMFNHIYRV